MHNSCGLRQHIAGWRVMALANQISMQPPSSLDRLPYGRGRKARPRGDRLADDKYRNTRRVFSWWPTPPSRRPVTRRATIPAVSKPNSSAVVRLAESSSLVYDSLRVIYALRDLREWLKILGHRAKRAKLCIILLLPQKLGDMARSICFFHFFPFIINPLRWQLFRGP